MADKVQVRETEDDEGRRLLRFIRRGSGSVVTHHRLAWVDVGQPLTLPRKVAGARQAAVPAALDARPGENGAGQVQVTQEELRTRREAGDVVVLDAKLPVTAGDLA
ncbi:hypothetical protein [Streptomyces sp. NPDC007905]|uniref:hypothetical protein n=1 Tax=Streptomyces sp. NPDC007905 TaxID=3364788 RepID=UPI0036ED13D9